MAACEEGNLTTAMTLMNNDTARAGARLLGQYDQTGANAAASWTIYTQSPSQMTANAQRTTEESGSGAARDLANQGAPASGT